VEEPAGLDLGSLLESLGEPDARLRSRAGRRFTDHVWADRGVAVSTDGNEIAFLEVFPPRSLERYEREIYEDPVNSSANYAISSIDELGDGPGFRKVRSALGIEAFGVNAVVYPPHFEGFPHYHDTQDELYFVHSGTAKVEVDGEERILGPGGLFHVESTTPRKIASIGDEELVMLVIGGKGGYVERDGHVTSDEDLERRISLGKEQP
jgi:mannose-6-phosphate isomerase-like protein (cupin superfamily)